MDVSQMGVGVKQANESTLATPAIKDKKNFREFYSRLDGCFYVLKTGKKIVFFGGVYETDIAAEIEELDELCTVPGQYLINKEPVPCKRSDAQIMKEVGGHQPSIVSGPVNSAGLIGMTR